MLVRVDQPVVYDGARAEIRGLQHVWMRVRLVAEPAAQFRTWAQGQRQPFSSLADPGPPCGAVARRPSEDRGRGLARYDDGDGAGPDADA
jgi:heme/copper-type cytochrome/quinol oxidase subunit 2